MPSRKTIEIMPKNAKYVVQKRKSQRLHTAKYSKTIIPKITL